MASVTELLLEAIKGPSASSGELLSTDGTSLTLQNTSYPASTPLTLDLPNGKSVTYSLASVYLQLCNPNVIQYRKACEAAKVEDPVKVLDRGAISEFFSAATDEGGDDAKQQPDGDADAMDMSDEDNKKEKPGSGGVQFRQVEVVGEDKQKPSKRSSSSSDKKRSRSSSQDKKRSSSSGQRQQDESAKKKKKVAAATPMTNEQLLDNLSTIVGKREQTLATGKEGEKATDDNKTDKSADSTKTTPDSRQVTPAATPLPSDNEQDQDKQKEVLMSCLSLPEGFDVNSPEIMSAIQSDREATRKITSLEIPVGDSSSILRAGAGGEVQVLDKSSADASGTNVAVKKRDFARVLEIYQEVIHAEEKAKRGGSSSSSKRSAPSALPGSSSKTASVAGSSSSGKTPTKKVEGNPIIVVPNAMTSCITMINAGFFFGKEAVFIPRDQATKRAGAGKRGGTIQVTHKLAPRLGGAEITYDIIDNPATRLKKEEWSRVVAVIAQGASWQFKGWQYSDPVELFSRAFGFYVGLDGASVPDELRNWNVKLGKVSRDRRGQDNICLASFWNGLEEFIAVHKQEYMK
mmetsp:Transcript_10694/g.17658  ORF Transcript_10694/g.17658 Transcript_10694/m.17658 type:complete len:575 (+) Transcript_10694:36-1760(+)